VTALVSAFVWVAPYPPVRMYLSTTPSPPFYSRPAMHMLHPVVSIYVDTESCLTVPILSLHAVIEKAQVTFILAKKFDPRAGFVTVHVPCTINGTYSIVLLGDWGMTTRTALSPNKMPRCCDAIMHSALTTGLVSY
jgi:hypothetical protein